MYAKTRNPTFAMSSWAAPLAICCLLFLLALIAATIVIALIPVYLSTRQVTVPNPTTYSFNTLYASDVSNGQSLTLSNTNSLSNQLNSGIPGAQNTLGLQSGKFLSAKAASKRKRQTSFGTITCDEATGLTGNIFSAQNNLNIPGMYRSQAEQTAYLNKYQNYIRTKNARKTVTMEFTTGTQTVTLAFCGFNLAVPTSPSSSGPSSSSPGASSSNSTQCTSETATYIYLLETHGAFYYFDPVTYDGYFVGNLNCVNATHAYSMAIQSNGVAWVLYDDGNLYTFNIQNGNCENTSYLYGQNEIMYFGMTFVNNTSTNTETIYLSTDTYSLPFRLATLNTTTMNISVVRYYDNIVGRAELTSTADGRLFGLFEGTPFIFAQINTTNADIISKTPQNSIQSVSDSAYFAVQAYQSNFFFFVGNNTFTNIYLYNPTTQTATLIKTAPFQIVGASASICINGFTPSNATI